MGQKGQTVAKGVDVRGPRCVACLGLGAIERSLPPSDEDEAEYLRKVQEGRHAWPPAPPARRELWCGSCWEKSHSGLISADEIRRSFGARSVRKGD